MKARLSNRTLYIITIYLFFIVITIIINSYHIKSKKNQMEMKSMERTTELSTSNYKSTSKQDILPILRECDTGKALRNSYLWLYYTLFLWGLLGTITWLCLGWPPSKVDKDINIISKKVMLIGIFLELILLSFLGMQDITRDGWEEKKLIYHTDNPINFFTSVQLILSSFVAVINLIFYYRENLYTKEERGYTIFLILSLGLLYGGLDEAFEFHEAMGYYYIPKLLALQRHLAVAIQHIVINLDIIRNILC